MELNSRRDVFAENTGLMGKLAAALRTLKLFALRQPLGAMGVVIILGLIIVVAIGPVIETTDDPYSTNPFDVPVENRSYVPVGEGGYLLGSDKLGRDIFSMLIRGARVTLYVSIVSTLAGVAIGAALGIVSATRGGTVDILVQRVVDSLMAFPDLILAMAIRAGLGASLENVIIAITIVIIPATARAVRSQTLSLTNMDYVTAARAVGAGYWRIVLRHVLPNVLALIIVLFSITLGGAIIVESSLSFLGLGSPVTEPTWGALMGGQEAYVYLREQPALVLAPAFAIALVVFGFNMLGDALRDVWDPRMRGSR